MEQRDGKLVETVAVSAGTPAALKKKMAAVNRLLKQLDKAEAQGPAKRRRRGEGSIHKDRGMHTARIELPRGPDGKRRRSKPVRSKDMATLIEKFDKLKADTAAGLPQLDRRLTVGAWLDHWSEKIAPGKMKPHPLASARAAINTRIKPAIGARYLTQLGADDIRYMHTWILEATYPGRDKETKEKIQIPYSTRSVEEAHNVLSGSLVDAVNEGKAHRNWCSVVTKPQVISKPHGALTSAQARAVLLNAQREHDPLVTRWAAGLMLGGRQGELLGLQWDRVDLEKGTLDLAWQLEWLPLREGADPEDPNRFAVQAGFEHIPLWRGAALTRPKSERSRRLLPLPAPLAAILMVFREHWKPNPWGLVWLSRLDHPIGDGVDRNAWYTAQMAVGIAPEEVVDVHGMRGTTATLLLEAGVDAKVIQEIMGHASVLTTRGYQMVDLTLMKTALGNLHGLLEIA